MSPTFLRWFTGLGGVWGLLTNLLLSLLGGAGKLIECNWLAQRIRAPIKYKLEKEWNVSINCSLLDRGCQANGFVSTTHRLHLPFPRDKLFFRSPVFPFYFSLGKPDFLLGSMTALLLLGLTVQLLSYSSGKHCCAQGRTISCRYREVISIDVSFVQKNK